MEVIDYGVTRLSIVPVRREPTDTSEQVTQLLFGDHYEVIEKDKTRKWLKIRIRYDRYEGWMDSKQHHTVSEEYYSYSQKAEFKICTDVTSSILYNKNPQIILMGSIIPISSSELFKMEEQFAYNGEAKNLGQKREYDYLKTIALRYRNAPYQWGGKSPFGIDCSGFVQMVFKISGYKLPRDSYQQAEMGRMISYDESQPGDLAFFKNEAGKVVHVGILLNEDKIIHASGWVRIDQFDKDGILDINTRVCTHQLAFIKRILTDL